MGSSGLGQSIRRLRLQQDMTGTELAERCRVTKGLISQIERGSTVPSLEVLVRIADALQVSVGNLLDTYGPRPRDGVSEVSSLPYSPLVRRKDRQQVLFPDENQLCHFLTPSLDGQIGFLLLEIGPLSPENVRTFTHGGEESLLVVEGELKVRLEDRIHYLKQGDSITYPATIPHSYECATEEPVKIVLAETPPAFCDVINQHLSKTASNSDIHCSSVFVKNVEVE